MTHTVQENSSQTANAAPAAAVHPLKPSSQEDPSCVDGLCEILQNSQELCKEQPEVLAHALHVVSVMWQVHAYLPPDQSFHPQPCMESHQQCHTSAATQHVCVGSPTA